MLNIRDVSTEPLLNVSLSSSPTTHISKNCTQMLISSQRWASLALEKPLDLYLAFHIWRRESPPSMNDVLMMQTCSDLGSSDSQGVIPVAFPSGACEHWIQGLITTWLEQSNNYPWPSVSSSAKLWGLNKWVCIKLYFGTWHQKEKKC